MCVSPQRWGVTAAGQRSDVDVRPVVRADLLDVFRIERRSFDQPWPYAAFERFLDAPGFLLADDGSPVGFVVADVLSEDGARIGHIKDLAVAPSHRRDGLGRTLLAEGLTVLATRGVGRVRLEVRPSNDAARALYEAFGFETDRVRRGYYADGEDAHVMKKPMS
ncbi:ribosomal protein S18-alanine N-acetyltransferase [Natronomonas sp.]|uniref:ribosomal protein S18-alanine N-acetyltransferase n=1 Tax=Natronomonas sp. TaxID=2184060 RepID=UPI0039C92EEE